MAELVRAKDSSGAVITIGADYAQACGLEVLKESPYDEYGKVRPNEPAPAKAVAAAGKEK